MVEHLRLGIVGSAGAQIRDRKVVPPMSEASVFLVEDEVIIRMMIAEMVEELGHRVVAEAGTISHAIDLAWTASFDLALLDVNVAGYGIAPVVEIVKARGLPLILLSGYGLKGIPPPLRDMRALQKPFLIEKLRATIDDVLRPSPNNHVG
jgi:CheY-like chemotaxis protein